MFSHFHIVKRLERARLHKYAMHQAIHSFSLDGSEQKLILKYFALVQCSICRVEAIIASFIDGLCKVFDMAGGQRSSFAFSTCIFLVAVRRKETVFLVLCVFNVDTSI